MTNYGTRRSPDGADNRCETHHQRSNNSLVNDVQTDDDTVSSRSGLDNTPENYPPITLYSPDMGCHSPPMHHAHTPPQPVVSYVPTAYSLPLDHRNEKKDRSLPARIYRFFQRIFAGSKTEEVAILPQEPSETSPLLGASRGAHVPASESSLEARLGDVRELIDSTATWKGETGSLVASAAPLVVTFMLQYLIDISSIVAVGRLGKVELGAVSLANMSASISCFAIFQGLATSLDTLCSQAYGSGNKHLVGLYCQRMTLFLFCLSVPISALWLCSEPIIARLVSDAEIARLASSYLHILIFALPGYALLETGKRFLQAQGLFSATTYVLLIGAPVNALLQWLLVWKLGLGFIGAPMAVVITRTLLPVLLILYTKLIRGSQCWGGFSTRAFANWWVMIRLAVPGMIMVEAEWLAFEINTVVSSRFGTEYLAAQSILIALTTISYQIPFPVSIAASTRVATLIGAGKVNDAKVAARVAVVASCLCTLTNFLVYIIFRHQLPLIFTGDPDVAAIATLVLPLVGALTFFDGITVAAHGLLRGIGKQAIGGPANLVAYYLVSLPLSLYLSFDLDWKIFGLWMGSTIGLSVVAVIEYTFLLMTDWRKAVMEAAARSAAG
ncbi:putative MATE efflux family protein subfamily [Dactylonectria macrodidyma]|uniref:MATE efflux family protein subfamily n=1 Tax=Dactylonectria macrodidyma TaxID=307937 RepID=A0A9P9ITW8_9HYPO|nr:putative MATE efflux family protein subfamily [Dactylonectria macrodidyma]